MREETTVPTCIVGGKTDNPCTRPATEHINHDADEAPDFCLVHALLCEAREALDVVAWTLDKYDRRERELR